MQNAGLALSVIIVLSAHTFHASYYFIDTLHYFHLGTYRQLFTALELHCRHRYVLRISPCLDLSEGYEHGEIAARVQ